MMTVWSMANCGATMCHDTWDWGAPWMRSSGGPSPPFTTLIVAPEVWTFSCLNPAGKKRSVSASACADASLEEVAVAPAVTAARAAAFFSNSRRSKSVEWDMAPILAHCG